MCVFFALLWIYILQKKFEKLHSGIFYSISVLSHEKISQSKPTKFSSSPTNTLQQSFKKHGSILENKPEQNKNLQPKPSAASTTLGAAPACRCESGCITTPELPSLPCPQCNHLSEEILKGTITSLHFERDLTSPFLCRVTLLWAALLKLQIWEVISTGMLEGWSYACSTSCIC